MNTKQGYVYILINPSLKGLLKVGQTKKDPEERAKEISQGTGVPTPYIVAYKEDFNDCELAEKMIHIMLEEEGYRINKNREFFEAEISDIIRKIMIVKEHLLSDENINNYDNVDDIEFTENEDLFSDFEDVEIEEPIKTNPWDDVEYIADASYYGYDDELEDYDKAYEYYIKAYKLGSPTACEQLGNMNLYGQSVRENKSLALNFYKEGVTRGNLGCWVDIGRTYIDTNISNAIKAYKKFLIYAPKDIIENRIYFCLFTPMTIMIAHNKLSKNDYIEIIPMLIPYKEILLQASYIQVEDLRKNSPELLPIYLKQIDFIENELNA